MSAPRVSRTALGSGVVPLPFATMVMPGEFWQASGAWLNLLAHKTYGIEKGPDP